MKQYLAALAIAAAALPASADTLAPYSEFYVFGDSLSDSGNAATIAGAFNLGFDYQSYPLGQFTNGDTWATQLGLTPSLQGGTNYATGGARAVDNGDPLPDLGAQVDQFVASGPTIGDNPLAAIWIGGNDFRDFLSAGAFDPVSVQTLIGGVIGEIASAVTTVAGAGIDDIVVFGLPDLGRLPDIVNTPFSPTVSGLVTSYNSLLQTTTVGLDTSLAQTSVGYFDVNSIFLSLLDAGNASGFENLTQACLANFAACQGNEDEWVFWDDIHPTEAVHQLVAGAFTDQVAPVPLPAGLPLLIGAFALLGVASRRRKSQA